VKKIRNHGKVKKDKVKETPSNTMKNIFDAGVTGNDDVKTEMMKIETTSRTPNLELRN